MKLILCPFRDSLLRLRRRKLKRGKEKNRKQEKMEEFLYATPYFTPASPSRQVQDPKIPKGQAYSKADSNISLANRDYPSIHLSIYLTYILITHFLGTLMLNITEKIKLKNQSLSQNTLKTCIQKYYNNSKVLVNGIKWATLLGKD